MGGGSTLDRRRDVSEAELLGAGGMDFAHLRPTSSEPPLYSYPLSSTPQSSTSIRRISPPYVSVALELPHLVVAAGGEGCSSPALRHQGRSVRDGRGPEGAQGLDR